MKYLKKYWWILFFVLAAVFVSCVALSPHGRLFIPVKNILDYLESLSVIVVGILGLIWAYPWLKKKATESYVEKQVDIIFEANKKLRNECIMLLDKYPMKMRSNDLSVEEVSLVLKDVQHLYSDSLEADYDAYRYSYLLYSSVKSFNHFICNGIPKGFHNVYYKEDFYSFIHRHVEQILQYASTVDSVARMSIDSHKILVKKVDKYVIGNDKMVLPGVDGKIRFKKADSLLVTFFGNNLSLPEGTHLLHESCYTQVPNVASFARLMNNQGWYAPLLLKVGVFLKLEEMRLDLVGYKQIQSYVFDTKEVQHFVILYYSNISEIGFVSAEIKGKNDIAECEDSYLDLPVMLKPEDISDMWIEGERVGIKVKRNILESHYKSIRHKLQSCMRKEK